MAERTWAALTVRAGRDGRPLAPTAESDALHALLDDYAPIAIEELAPIPLPPGGLWDPTYPPPPEPPPAPVDWRVFFESPEAREAAAEAIRRHDPTLDLVSEDISDADWAARSQQALTAVRAGDIIVAPPWDLPDPTPDDVTVVIIEPSRGFGTGHHASTRLCLDALSAVDLRGKDVLDLGTGSGVLALAASLRGAASVTAVDVDPDAIASAQESARLNPAAGRIDWRVADFRTDDGLRQRVWDLVLANLTGGMLQSAAAPLDALVADDGVLVVSGFDETEQPAVERTLNRVRLRMAVEDGWVGLTLGPRRD